MRQNSIKYNALLAVANGDGPLTCAEAYEQMDEENRPKENDAEDGNEWANMTSHMSALYADHYVDRRKRDVEQRPFEYWLAGKGRERLREDGYLDTEPDGDVPVPVNESGDDQQDGEEEQTDASAEAADEEDGTDAGDKEAADGEQTVSCNHCGAQFDVDIGTPPESVLGGHLSKCTERPDGQDIDVSAHLSPTIQSADPDEISERLGINDPDVDTGRALSETVAGLVTSLREVQREVEASEPEAAADDQRDYEEDIAALEGRVSALQDTVARLTEGAGETEAYGEFAPYIRRLTRLAEEGYAIWEADIQVARSQSTVEINVKAKPEADCRGDIPGPDGDDRVTVSKAPRTVRRTSEESDD